MTRAKRRHRKSSRTHPQKFVKILGCASASLSQAPYSSRFRDASSQKYTKTITRELLRALAALRELLSSRAALGLLGLDGGEGRLGALEEHVAQGLARRHERDGPREDRRPAARAAADAAARRGHLRDDGEEHGLAGARAGLGVGGIPKMCAPCRSGGPGTGRGRKPHPNHSRKSN